MIISFGTSAYDNKIRQKKYNVDQLYDILAKDPIVRKSKDGPYFIMASFDGNKRRGSQIKEFFGAVIDLDDTDLDLADIKKTFRKYNHVIYTTHNHVIKGNRYRLVLPYKSAVLVEQHRTAMMVLMFELGLQNVDLSSKAIARPMYLPSCPSTHKHLSEFHENKRRNFYDATKAELSPEMQFELAQMKETAAKFDPNEKYSEGGRNDALTRLVGKFIKNGFDLSTILGSAKAWSDTNCSPPLDDNEIETIVNSVYNSHKRNSKDSKWGFDEVNRRVKSMNKDSYQEAIDLTVGSIDSFKPSEKELLVREIHTKFKMPIKIVRDEIKTESLKRSAQTEEDEEAKEGVTVKQLKEQFDHFVFLARDNKVFNLDNGETYKTEGFNNNFSYVVPKGGILQLLIKHHCVKKADLVMYNPMEDVIFNVGKTKYANRYVSNDIKPRKGEVKKMLRHFKYLIADRKERKLILDYIAFIVQNPGVKVKWMPIIKGTKGIGKSIIANEILMPILGHKNIKTPSSLEIGNQFNAWMLDTQLIVFHELKIGNTRKDKLNLTDNLKELITEPMLSAHYKGIDPYQVFNFANALGFTNHEDAIMMTHDERRFVMIKSEAKRKGSAYYKRLVNWLRLNVKQMYYYFLNRNLDSFNPSEAVETNYTRQVKRDSLLFPSLQLQDALEDQNHIFNTDRFTTIDRIIDWLSETAVGGDVARAEQLRERSHSYMLTNALRDLGFKKWEGSADGRIMYEGRKQTIWKAPYARKKSKDQLINLLNSQAKNWEF